MMKRKRVFCILFLMFLAMIFNINTVNAENVAHYFEVYKCPVNSENYANEAQSCYTMYENGELESYQISNNGNLSIHGDTDGLYNNIILVVGKINVKDNDIYTFNTCWNWDPNVLSLIPQEDSEDGHVFFSDPYKFPIQNLNGRKLTKWSTTVNFYRYASEGIGIFLANNTSAAQRYDITQTTVSNGTVEYLYEFFMVNPDSPVGTYTNIILNDSNIQYAEATNWDLEAVYYDPTNFKLKIYGSEDDDNTLGQLHVYQDNTKETEYTIDPTFEAGQNQVKDYTVTVPNNITSVYIDGLPNSNKYKEITGVDVTKTDLAVGANEFAITITAQNGNEFTYTVTIYRLSNDATLKTLTLTNEDITFNEELNLETTTVYTASVPYAVGHTTLNAEVNYDKAYIQSGADDLQTIEIDWDLPEDVKGQSSTKTIRVYSENCQPEYIGLNGNTSEMCNSNTYSVTVTREPADTDSSLKTLTVKANNYEQGYTQTTRTVGSTEYTAYELNSDIPYIIDELNIEVEANNELATVTSGTGDVHINVGDNYLPIVITAQDGSSTTYYVIAHRKNNDATLSGLTVTSNPVGTFAPDFNPSYNNYYTYTYDAVVSNVTITATTTDQKYGSVAINDVTVGSSATPNEPSLKTQTQTFNVTSDTINVVVTAEDGTTNTYILYLTRTKSSNSYLANLEIKDQALNELFSSKKQNYTSNVDGQYHKVTLKARPSVVYSNITSIILNNSPVTFTADETNKSVEVELSNLQFPTTARPTNRVEITVVAEDNTERIYTLDITRELYQISSLENLTLTGYPFDEGFTSGETEYHVTSAKVPYATTSVDISGTLTNEYATVKLYDDNGNEITSTLNDRVFTGTIPVYTGKNTITAKVYAHNTDEKYATSYTIEIERTKNTNTNISSILVNGASSTPVYMESLGKYVVTVPNTKTKLSPSDVVVITSDTNAIVEKSAEIELSTKHDNEYTFKVIAEDGTTEQEYTLSVTRTTSAENDLINVDIYATSDGENFIYQDSCTPGATSHACKVSVTTGTIKYKFVTTISDEATITPDDTTIYDMPAASSTTEKTLTVTAENTVAATYTITVERSLSANVRLSEITINGTEVQPFDPENKHYYLNYEHSVTTATVTAKVEDVGKAEIITDLSQPFPLDCEVAENLITINVRAENPDVTRTYYLHIVRKKNSDSSLTDLKLDDVSITGFTPANKSYTASAVDYEKTSIKVTPTLNDDEHASYTITNINPDDNDSVLYEADSEGNITLHTGNNVILVKVTAQDETTSNYRVYIERKKNDNTGITKVTVAGVEATQDESPNVYNVTVPNTVDLVNQDNVEFEFEAGLLETDDKPSYQVTEKTLVTAPSNINTVMVVVTAPDGSTTKDVYINVTRTLSNRASLHTLTITANEELGSFKPLFVAEDESADEITYNVAVPKNSDDFTVNFIKMNLEHITDEKASVACKLNDEDIDCSSTMSINQQSGEAELKVIVTSEDGEVTRTYILNLSRAKSSDAEIKPIVVKDKNDNELTWVETNGAYQVTVPASTADVDITVEPNSAYASVFSVEYNLNGNDFTPNLDHTYTIPIEDIGYEYNHGMNIVVICVMAENGDKKYHTVVLNKELNNDITLSSFKVDEEEHASDFENTATSLYEYRYTTVEYNKTYVILNVTTNDSYASYQITGGQSVVNNGTDFQVNLSTGSNTILTTVTAQDGTVGYHYLYVNRKKNSDKTFKKLMVSGVSASCNTVNRMCSVTVPNETDTMYNDNTEIVFQDPAATYDALPTFNVNTTPLSEGVITPVMVTVEAEDGTTVDYIVNVTRSPSDVSTASDIEVSTTIGTNGAFTPGFKPNIYEYTVALVSTADEFTVNVEKTNENATVTGDGTYSFTDDDTDGDEKIVIPVVIKSQGCKLNTSDPNYERLCTETTYTLNVIRGQNSISTLGQLKIYDTEEKEYEYTLTPEFVADNVQKVDYSVDVLGSVTRVYLDSIVTEKSRATIKEIKVNGQVITDGSRINSYEGYVDLVSNTANLVLINVLSEDTYSSTIYRLTINRAANIDSKLSSLKANGNEYIDETDENYLATMYTDLEGVHRVDGIVIPNSKSSINVSAIKHDPNATFTTKLKIPNGSETTVTLGDIAVPTGTSEITLTVTAEDGITKDVYVIEVTREPSTDSRASYVMFYDKMYQIQDDKYDYYYEVTDINLTEIKDENVTITTKAEGTEVVKPGTVQIITSENDPTMGSYYATEYTFRVWAEDKTHYSDYTFYIHKNYSSNANLAEVKLSKGTISPKFNPSVTQYTITVPYGTATFEVTGIAEEPETTTVTGNGIYNYEENLVIQIKTLAEDGKSKQTYKFVVMQAESTDAYLNSLEVVGYTFDTTFKKTLFNYNMEDISFGTTHLAVSYIQSNSNSTVVCDMDGTVDDCSQMSVPQIVGTHKITVNVTAQDSVTKRAYTIDFNVTPSTNAYLLDFTATDPEGNDLVFGFSRAITSGYKITVPYTTESVTFEAIATSEFATLRVGTSNVNGASSEDINYYRTEYDFNDLVVGQNIISVTVIPQDPSAQSKTYTVIVNRAKQEASKVVTLSSLELLDVDGNAYTLDPEFTSEVTEYSIGEIPFLTDTIKVNATATDTKAQILYLVNGNVQTSTDLSIPVTDGNGYIQLYVVAEDGITTGTYTINYRKVASDDWTIWDLNIYGQYFPFNPYIQEQNYYFNFDQISTVITFKPHVSGTQVKIGDKVYSPPIDVAQTYMVTSLAVGDNEVQIECTAEDGTVGYYVLHLIREGSTDKITSEVHEVTEPETGVGYVKDVAVNTKSTEMKDQLDNDNEYIKIFKADDSEEIGENDIIGTGMIIKLIVNSLEADRKLAVVPGDVNGTGDVDIVDLGKIVDHILSQMSGSTDDLLLDVYYVAGNVKDDSEIDISDLGMVVDIILNNME